jgi:hypothetical protein
MHVTKNLGNGERKGLISSGRALPRRLDFFGKKREIEKRIKKVLSLRACWDFAFGANAAKFYSEQGAMREHSRSYVTEEQRSSGENLARTAQRVKSKQALNDRSR